VTNGSDSEVVTGEEDDLDLTVWEKLIAES
jgi:hypothetical protein